MWFGCDSPFEMSWVRFPYYVFTCKYFFSWAGLEFSATVSKPGLFIKWANINSPSPAQILKIKAQARDKLGWAGLALGLAQSMNTPT